MEVHEHPLLHGSVGELKSRLDHQDYRGLKNYLARHNEYSSWEANRYLWLDQADVSAWAELNPRQKFKYRNLHRWWLAWLYWFVAVIVKKGFLDGPPGIALGRFKRHYFQEIRLKIQEARRTGKAA